jgi:single-stranded-DNA-specific exonuclease
VIAPRLEWLLPEPLLDPPAFSSFSAPIATLLARRGFRDEEQLRAFLHAGESALHDTSLMADADRALDRLEAALDRGERIAIWGDYDADGMTSVAIWSVALRALGAEAIRHVPSRLADGYGLSTTGLDRLAAGGVSLVVTCDCGVGNVAEVEHASRIGMDVIVTDHHLPGPDLPPAAAVVDPHRADCSYPDPDLTGAGVSYKLAVALLRRRGREVVDLAALAAIGTIADMAPMTGESRAIVRLGLAELAATERAGLRALLARAVEHPDAPTARDLAFGVAPRINSAGRIDDAELAIRLLLEEDRDAAERLAEELEAVQRRRRELTLAAVDDGRRQAAEIPGDGPLLVRGDEWAPGIVGLVAGRLCDALSRPVGAVARVGDELRGSVRAPVDFNVVAALECCAEHLTKRGGHAGAGGFSLLPDAWEAFVAAFTAIGRPYPADPAVAPERGGRMAVDLVLPARRIGWALAGEIDRLAPFGPGHVEPTLAVHGLRLGAARRVGADGDHVAFRLLRDSETIDGIAFRVPADRELPEPGSDVDVVGTLERDTFQGEPRLRLRIEDYATADASPIAARRRPPAAASAAAVAGGVVNPVPAGA